MLGHDAQEPSSARLRLSARRSRRAAHGSSPPAAAPAKIDRAFARDCQSEAGEQRARPRPATPEARRRAAAPSPARPSRAHERLGHPARRVRTTRARPRTCLRTRSRSGRTCSPRPRPFTEKVVRDGATLYRARFSGFDEAEAAQQACRALSATDFACFATRSWPRPLAGDVDRSPYRSRRVDVDPENVLGLVDPGREIRRPPGRDGASSSGRCARRTSSAPPPAEPQGSGRPPFLIAPVRAPRRPASASASACSRQPGARRSR